MRDPSAFNATQIYDLHAVMVRMNDLAQDPPNENDDEKRVRVRRLNEAISTFRSQLMQIRVAYLEWLDVYKKFRYFAEFARVFGFHSCDGIIVRASYIMTDYEASEVQEDVNWLNERYGMRLEYEREPPPPPVREDLDHWQAHNSGRD